MLNDMIPMLHASSCTGFARCSWHSVIIACWLTLRCDRRQQTEIGACSIGRWDNAAKPEIRVTMKQVVLQPTDNVRADLTIFRVVGSYAIWLTQVFEQPETQHLDRMRMGDQAYFH